MAGDRGANAAEIFGRAAWAMPVGYNGNAAFALGTAEEKDASSPSARRARSRLKG